MVKNRRTIINKKGRLQTFLCLQVISILMISGCSNEKTATLKTETIFTATSAPQNTQSPFITTEPDPFTALAPTQPIEAGPTESQQNGQAIETSGEVLLSALPPDPQLVEFLTGDGQVHAGTYYPAAHNPAPGVLLMHWAPGDQNEWNEIAYWLQNRGLSGTSANTGNASWLDSSWFPPLAAEKSYAVLTFTFRECDGGCSNFLPDEWLLDAQAAMITIKGLDGVDPSKIVTIGASIGADGAVDACGDGCLGAISLSPGGYLNIPYPEAVEKLESVQPPIPVLCLAAERDIDSFNACSSARGNHYTSVFYPGTDHGLSLINPGSDPETLELILNFLGSLLGR